MRAGLGPLQAESRITSYVASTYTYTIDTGDGTP